MSAVERRALYARHRVLTCAGCGGAGELGNGNDCVGCEGAGATAERCDNVREALRSGVSVPAGEQIPVTLFGVWSWLKLSAIEARCEGRLAERDALLLAASAVELRTRELNAQVTELQAKVEEQRAELEGVARRMAGLVQRASDAGEAVHREIKATCTHCGERFPLAGYAQHACTGRAAS